MHTTLNYSPNFDTKRRDKKNIKFIIFHYTGMKKELDAIKKSKSRNLKSKLRRSKNLLEAIKAAVAIAEESKKTTTHVDA